MVAYGIEDDEQRKRVGDELIKGRKRIRGKVKSGAITRNWGKVIYNKRMEH